MVAAPPRDSDDPSGDARSGDLHKADFRAADVQPDCMSVSKGPSGISLQGTEGDHGSEEDQPVSDRPGSCKDRTEGDPPMGRAHKVIHNRMAQTEGDGLSLRQYLKGVWTLRYLLVLVFTDVIAYGPLVTALPVISRNFFSNHHCHTAELHCPVRCDELPATNQSLPQSAADRVCELGTTDALMFLSYDQLGAALIIFLASPTLGAWSDSVGRRLPLILCTIVQLISKIALVLHALYPADFSLYWYYLADGIFSTNVKLGVLLSYAADLMRPNLRAAGFAMILAAMMLSLMASVQLGKVLSIKNGLLLGIGSNGISIFWAAFLVPESLADSNRVQFKSASVLNPFRTVSILGRSWLFRGLASVVVLCGIQSNGVQDIQTYYLIDRFHIGRNGIANLSVVSVGVGFIFQTVVCHVLITFLRERRTLVLSLIITVASNIWMGIIDSWWEAIVCSVVMQFGLLQFPAISAIKSNLVDDSEQGRIQGALSGAQSLGGSFGPLIFSAVYKRTATASGLLHGAAWYAAAGTIFLALLIAVLTPDKEVILRHFNAVSDSKSSSSQSPDGAADASEGKLPDVLSPLLGADDDLDV